MRVITYGGYGDPENLELKEGEVPTPSDDEVLVRVRAASVNPYDWHFMRGKPYLMRAQSGIRHPKQPRLGVDVAGIVEAAGETVTGLRAGDEVFGGATGAFAEFVCARPKNLAHKPPGVSFEEAATLNIAGLTALQGLREISPDSRLSRVSVTKGPSGPGNRFSSTAPREESGPSPCRSPLAWEPK